MSSLHYNPLALETAYSAWTTPGTSLGSRVIHTALGTLNDIFVKNPYHLTVGNMRHAQSAPKTHVALASLGVLYSLMLYGSNSYLLGKSLVALGSCTAGHLLQRVGEKLFLTGAVPLYGAFYAFPKKIIHSIPPLALLITTKITQSVQWIFNHVFMPLWTHAILPVLRALYRISHAISDAIESVIRAIFTHVLKPLADYILCPAIRLIGRIVSKLAYALRYIATTIERCAEWIFNTLLRPLWNHVIHPCLQRIQFLATALVNKVEQLVTQLLLPLSNALHALGTALLQGMQAVIDKVEQLVKQLLLPLSNALHALGTALLQGMQAVIDKTAQCAAWVFQKTVLPCWQVIQIVGHVLFDTLILPITSCAQAILNHYIVPMAREIASGCTALGQKLYEVGTDTLEGIALSWRNVAHVFLT
jgi:phage-related protein